MSWLWACSMILLSAIWKSQASGELLLPFHSMGISMKLPLCWLTSHLVRKGWLASAKNATRSFCRTKAALSSHLRDFLRTTHAPRFAISARQTSNVRTLGLSRCSKVPNVRCPKEKQGHLLQMSCFPKAGFGIELNTASKKDFKSFPTDAARAVGLSSEGCIPLDCLELCWLWRWWWC